MRHGTLVVAAASVLLMGLTGSAVFAHDFWIEPSEYEPKIGTTLDVGLRVGQHFVGDPVPRNDAQIERFVMIGSKGETPIGGADGDEPAGTAPIAGRGLTILGYRSRPSPVTLEAPKFEQYLADEGLDAIVAARAKKGESAKPGREIFSRCAKAIVLAGPDAPDPQTVRFDRALGLTLELIPKANPYAWSHRGEFPVELLYQGKPLPDALVVAMSIDDPLQPLKARSNAKGIANLPLGRNGVWLIKSVHMIPAPADSGADWESLWASLTFDLAAPYPPKPRVPPPPSKP